jgi:hypothetical protein
MRTTLGMHSFVVGPLKDSLPAIPANRCHGNLQHAMAGCRPRRRRGWTIVDVPSSNQDLLIRASHFGSDLLVDRRVWPHCSRHGCATADAELNSHHVRPTGRTASWRLQPISISHADNCACGTGCLANQLPGASASSLSRTLLRQHAEQSEAAGRAHAPQIADSATKHEKAELLKAHRASRASDTHAHVGSATNPCGVRAPFAGDRPAQRNACGAGDPVNDLTHDNCSSTVAADVIRRAGARAAPTTKLDRSSQRRPDLLQPAELGEHELACLSSKPGAALTPTFDRVALRAPQSPVSDRIPGFQTGRTAHPIRQQFPSRTWLVRHQQPGEAAAPKRRAANRFALGSTSEGLAELTSVRERTSS